MYLRKLLIDPGHTGVGDPGATGHGLREADLNLDIGLRLYHLLDGVPGLQVRLTRDANRNLVEPYAQSTDLMARVDMANGWGADLFLSLHINAAENQNAHGYETWVYVNASAESRRFAAIVHKHLKVHWRIDRGIKDTPDFWVLKHTKMPAVLVENGFITNRGDAERLADDAFRQGLAESIRDAIFEAYPHLKPAAPPLPAGLTPIIGETRVSLTQMLTYMRGAVSEANSDKALEIARALWDFHSIYNVRPEVAAGLILHETGRLAFGGIVHPSQHNYGGIGATGVPNADVDLNSIAGQKLLGGVDPSRVSFIPGQHGWTFKSLQDGVEAVVQHLYAYATAAPLPRAVVDPRYVLVNKGSARHLEELGGKWAWPGYDTAKYPSLEAAFAAEDTYGHTIRNRYVRPLIDTVAPPEPPAIDWEARARLAEEKLAQIHKLSA